MKTVLHSYYFDTRNPAEKAQYEELKAKLEGMGLNCFETHGGNSHYIPSLDGEIELDTTNFLCDNQWNTAPKEEGKNDHRVFDWAQDYESNIGVPRGIKRGHWLEQTEEMTAIRRDTLKCGYCGHMEPVSAGLSFCPKCAGSEYLKSSELHLTRLAPVADGMKPRAPLTEEEKEILLPIYKEAKIRGRTEADKKRIAKKRQDLKAEYDQAIANAEAEYNGFLWFMDRGVKTDDLIYYKHTGRFCFGWRGQGVDPEILSEILDIISEFPYPYEIKCSDGRNLQGN